MVLILLLAFLMPIFATAPAQALPVQDPDIEWRTLETEHLRLYYPERLSLFAAEVSKAAESAWQRLTQSYNVSPGRTTLTLWDTSEFANGSALAARNQVQLYGVTDRILLRGTHPWVWNVATHEFSHIFSLTPARFLPPMIPGISFGALLRRDHLARGGNFGKGGGSFYLSSESVPRWFAEGIAQYDAEQAGHDGYDSIRLMLLRAALLEDKEISWTGLETTSGKSQIEAELVYNEGYAFVRWLAERFGEPKLIELTRAPKDQGRILFNRGFKPVFGQSGEELFAQFLSEKRVQAESKVAEREAVTDSTWFEQGRFTTWIKQGTNGRLAVIGSGSSHYDEAILYVSKQTVATDAKPEKKDFVEIRHGLLGNPAWDQSGNLWYCVAGAKSFKGYRFGSLRKVSFKPNGEPDHDKRVGPDLRCSDLVFDQDDGLIASIVHNNTRNLIHLAASALTGESIAIGEATYLTTLAPPASARYPVVASDGTILFTLATTHETDLAWLHPGPASKATIHRLLWPGSSEKDPLLLDDRIWFVSDRDDNVFDLWSAPWPLSGKAQRHTNTRGGIFAPQSLNHDKIVAIQYNHEQFAAFQVDVTDAVSSANLSTTEFAPIRDNGTLNILHDHKAGFHWARPLIIPEMLYEYEDLKAGLALIFSDEIGFWRGELEVLAGTDADVSFAGGYYGWYLPLQLRYDYYRRHYKLDLDGLEYRMRSGYHSAEIGSQLDLGSQARLYADFSVSRYNLHFPSPEALRWESLAGTIQAVFSSVPPAPDADINPRGGNVINGRLKLARSFPSEALFPGLRIADYAVLGFSYRNYLPLGSKFTLEFGVQADGLVGWNPTAFKPVAPEVSAFDQLFLGGEFFSLRRGIFQSYKGFSGYDEFTVSGNWLGMLDLTLRWEMARRIFSVGPFYMDGLYLETNSGIGRAWPHSLRWVALREQILHKSFWIDPASLLERPVGSALSREQALASDLGFLAETSISVRAKMILWGAFPWNSYLKISRGWQDPFLLGYRYNPLTDKVEKGDKLGLPFRIYLGIGTGF